VYFLEARKGDDDFEDFDEGALSVHLIGFHSASGALEDPPRIVRMKKNSTVRNLMEHIAGFLLCTSDTVRVMRFTTVSMSSTLQTVENLSLEPAKRLREDLLLFDTSRLYYEDNTFPMEDSPLCRAYLNASNLVTIKVNRPPTSDMNIPISIDRRCTTSELRQLVADTLGTVGVCCCLTAPHRLTIDVQLGRPVNDIHMYRNFARGTPIFDSSETLLESCIQSCVYVDFYPPPKEGRHGLVL
jgi:hypothetical protein